MINILTPPSTFSPATSSLSRHTALEAPHQSRKAAYGRQILQKEDIGLLGRPGWMGHATAALAGSGPSLRNGGQHGVQFDARSNSVTHKASSVYQAKAVPSALINPARQSGALPAQHPPNVPYQPSSPVKAPVFEALGTETDGADSSDQIVSYLQIPASINGSKGSLSDFAAQITCLFWFESSYTLHRVEESPTTPTPTTPLVDEAKPCMGFRKWVTTMLSTTQVTQNVILLALLFIYRLKKQNPQVKGKLGSEYRLLTVALMLGNKFLDDNTYTNKTWADVSGISVGEIHVMEVEFLSNMRYNLYTSKEEWMRWHKKLGRFWDYFDRASKASELRALAPPLSIPSPPQSQHTSPSFVSQDHATSAPVSTPPYLGPTYANVPSVMRMPELDHQTGSRKRSYDEAAEDTRAAKRVLRSNSGSVTRPMHSRMPSNSSTMSSMGAEHAVGPILPMPMYHQQQMPFSQPANMPGAHISHLALPQTRAMGMLFGPGGQLGQSNGSAVAYHQQQQHGNLARLQIPPIYGAVQPRGSTPMQAGSAMPTPMQHGSALSTNTNLGTPLAATGSANGSPTNLALTTNSELLSPAGFTIQRSSPYRPVRAVNTLLVPPPSGSFHNPPAHLQAANMHYQPLGRPPSERRVGVVPFVHSDQVNWVRYSPYR